MVERAWIKTAWIIEGDELPCLVAAYDEMTFEAWGKEPDFYRDDISKYLGGGDSLRECYIEVDLGQIKALFSAPTVQGVVLPSDALDGTSGVK